MYLNIVGLFIIRLGLIARGLNIMTVSTVTMEYFVWNRENDPCTV